jgi:hypothetical protein
VQRPPTATDQMPVRIARAVIHSDPPVRAGPDRRRMGSMPEETRGGSGTARTGCSRGAVLAWNEIGRIDEPRRPPRAGCGGS